jgi:hypothetical protein
MNKFKRAVQISEVVGAVAVVISLIYVGTEIRQNTLATRLSNQQISVTMGYDADAWLSNSDFAEVYELGLRDLSKLTAAQRIQFSVFIGQRLNIWEYVFYSHNDGMISEDTWTGWDVWFKSEFQHESLRILWRTSKREGFAGEFQSYVDAYVADEL